MGNFYNYTSEVTVNSTNIGGQAMYKYYSGGTTVLYAYGSYVQPRIDLQTNGLKNKQITVKILNVEARNKGYAYFFGTNDAAGSKNGVTAYFINATGGTYDATTKTRTYTLTCNYPYLWATPTSTSNIYYDSFGYTFSVSGEATPTWTTDFISRFGNGTKSILPLSTNGTGRIHELVNMTTTSTSYGYTSGTASLYYLPSDTTEREIQILSSYSNLTFFTANSTSNSDVTSIQKIVQPTTMALGSQTLYTVTVPANKILYITVLVNSGSGGTTYFYDYGGVNPDEIGYHLDAGWNDYKLHKSNGTSWD